MQKIVVVLITLFLGIGLTQPGGYMQFCNMEEQYEQCSREDHDITPLDFVFEHLLNLESIVNLLEGEHEYVGDDQPHLPFQNLEVAPSVFLALPVSHNFYLKNNVLFEPAGVTYSQPPNDKRLSNFFADIFRPPIAA
jgi:hypothetical protein